MAPNKFDKDIQQKFNSRKIEPSAQAWDRLNAMLTIAEEKKQTPNFNWLKIAATFLVFTGVGYFLLEKNKEIDFNKPSNEVVYQKETILNEVTEEKENQQIITTTKLAVATTKVKNKIIQKKIKTGNNTETKSKLATFLALTEKQEVQITTIENKENQKEILKQPEGSVQIKKNTYNYVNPETLLAEVQGEKKKNGTTNTYQSTLKVNSKDLLHDVETELDKTIKNKALTRLKQAKTAIVNRNYN